MFKKLQIFIVVIIILFIIGSFSGKQQGGKNNKLKKLYKKLKFLQNN